MAGPKAGDSVGAVAPTRAGGCIALFLQEPQTPGAAAIGGSHRNAFQKLFIGRFDSGEHIRSAESPIERARLWFPSATARSSPIERFSAAVSRGYGKSGAFRLTLNSNHFIILEFG